MIRNCCGTRVATFMRLAIVPSALLLVAATAPRTLHAQGYALRDSLTLGGFQLGAGVRVRF